MKKLMAGSGMAIALAALMVLAGAPRASARTGVAGDPVKGKQVYLNANPKCSLCHKIGDAGGKLAPDLSAVGTKRDAAWLAKYLPNPKVSDPKNKMPPTKATGKDLEDLIAYLLTLKSK